MIEHDHMYNQTVHKFSMINLILEIFWKHFNEEFGFRHVYHGRGCFCLFERQKGMGC